MKALQPDRLTRYPYSSRRSVVMSRGGMVVCSQQLAAQAGLEMIAEGGSAVDAAVAAAAVLTVTEPTSNGIGGDAFAIVWENGQIHGLDSSGPAPSSISIDKLVRQGYSVMPTWGWKPVTVPGAPAAWATLNRRFGRLPFRRLLEPAVRLASEGFPVSPVVAEFWNRAAESYQKRPEAADGSFDEWYRVFSRDGKSPRAGEVFTLKDHATTLIRIAETEGKDFYRGELADRTAAASAAGGGFLQPSDLESFQPRWIDPISIDYRGITVWELPPHVQGIVTLEALGILDGHEAYLEALQRWPVFGAAGFFQLPTGTGRGSRTSLRHPVHYRIEALKAAFADGLRWITDPAYMRMPTEQLLSAALLEEKRRTIGSEASVPAPVELPSGGTVHLAAADGSGMMVSYIQSNYHGFGSGIVVPGTGIALHNRGCTFSLDRRHANALFPGKKTYHTIMPGFLSRGGKPLGPFGVMGGYMQPQGHLQVITGLADMDLNPQAALDAPRWQWIAGKKVAVESGFSSEQTIGLSEAGHEVMIDPDPPQGYGPARGAGAGEHFFGRGQIILADTHGTLFGGVDHRADGAACTR